MFQWLGPGFGWNKRLSLLGALGPMLITISFMQIGEFVHRKEYAFVGVYHS